MAKKTVKQPARRSKTAAKTAKKPATDTLVPVRDIAGYAEAYPRVRNAYQIVGSVARLRTLERIHAGTYSCSPLPKLTTALLNEMVRGWTPGEPATIEEFTAERRHAHGVLISEFEEMGDHTKEIQGAVIDAISELDLGDNEHTPHVLLALAKVVRAADLIGAHARYAQRDVNGEAVPS